MMMTSDPLPLRSVETVSVSEKGDHGAQSKRESLSIEATRGMAAPVTAIVNISSRGLFQLMYVNRCREIRGYQSQVVA